MLTHYRHRRGMYPLSPRPRLPGRLIVIGIFFLAVLFFFGRSLLHLFGFGSPIDTPPAILSVEDRGIVSVLLEGNQSKNAENGMKLFQGEKLSTGPTGGASLTFFDGSLVRLDGSTDLTITESRRTKDAAAIVLTLDRGTVWTRIPTASGSGSVQHTIHTSLFSYSLPEELEAVVSPTSLLVFSAGNAGVSVSLPKHDTIQVGEGQKLLLPPTVVSVASVAQDLYSYRLPLDASTVQLPFLDDSRRLWATARTGTGAVAAVPTGTELLTVLQPTDALIVSTDTVQVRGTLAPSVDAVKVNGYPAVVDREKGTFSLELAIPDGSQQFDVRVQAFDTKQMPLNEIHRLVKRPQTQTGSTLGAPTITSPAKAGETYRTSKDELILRGDAPAGATAIYVNEYKLQLFNPEKGTWSYLASLKLGNMKTGSNIYDITATQENGQRSPGARITIVSGSGADGVVSSAAAPTSATIPNPSSLPTNAPLTPGMLKVTGDAAKMGFVASGTGFLLEGATSADTASVWINGYKLQLYKPGKTFWNYLASPDLKTLKEGKNTFTVIARNNKDEILDTLTITVEYQK